MKFHLYLLTSFALTVCAFAEEKVTISGVHNCCKKCADGITKAVTSVPGVTAEVDKTTVSLTASSAAELQKAADALIEAGYTGESSNPAVKLAPPLAPDEKVSELTISGTHLCCDKCVKGAEKAIQATAGVTGHDAVKGAKSFKVQGEFNAKELTAALNKAGYAGKASK